MTWTTLLWIAVLAVAYLVGSIPSAYIAGRLLKRKDIREEGDKNPGAGNAYRTIGPKTGIAVGTADIAKGAVAVLIARVLTGSVGVQMAAGVVVVVGHNWPVLLGLRGGRGAASAIGVLMALMPIPAIPVSLTSLALLPLVKNSTKAIGLFMIPMPVLALVSGVSYPLVIYSVGLPVMVGVRHYFSSRASRLEDEKQAGRSALTKVK